jgi:peptidoglycan-N-acetylglucosamine deacetylase
MEKKYLVTSWDDGSKFDVRLAELLLKYNIPAIFYIPTCCELSNREILDLSKYFSVGGHTTTHPNDIKRLSFEDQLKDISENKKWLEDILGKEVTAFCYPSGKGDIDTVRAVKMAGYREARRVGWGNTEYPKDLFNIKPTAFIHPDTKKFGGKSWYDYAFDLVGSEYYHLWGHSHEVEKYGLWQELENLFIVMSNSYETKTR